MVINYIWIAFFLIALVVGLVRLIFFGDTEIFTAIVNSTFEMAKVGFEISLGLTGVLTLWLGLMKVGEMGGAVAAVENAYMKQRLVESQTERRRAIEEGRQTVVGVNAYTESEPSPLLEGGARAILTVDESAEHEQVERLRAFRARRSQPEVAAALRNLRDVVASGGNVMPPSIRCAHAGVTTGEWSDALRALFGEYRAPTGVSVPRAQSSG